MRTAEGRRVVRGVHERPVTIGIAPVNVGVVDADVRIVAGHNVGHPHPFRVAATQALQHNPIIHVILVAIVADRLTAKVVFREILHHLRWRALIVGERIAKVTPAKLVDLVPLCDHACFLFAHWVDKGIAGLLQHFEFFTVNRRGGPESARAIDCLGAGHGVHGRMKGFHALFDGLITYISIVEDKENLMGFLFASKHFVHAGELTGP